MAPPQIQFRDFRFGSMKNSKSLELHPLNLPFPQFSENLKSAEFDKFVEIFDELPIISFEEGLKYLSEV